MIHNASFDMKFLNSELEESGRKPIPNSKVVDTLKLAREVFPGEKNSLDALCKRLNIDLSNRNIHNGLIDCSLLIDVYRHLSEEEPLSFNTQIYDQLLNALEQSKIEVRKSTNFIWEGIKIFVIVAIVIYVYNLFFN